MDDKGLLINEKIQEYFSGQVYREDIEDTLKQKLPLKYTDNTVFKSSILPLFHKYLSEKTGKVNGNNIEYNDPFPREINRLNDYEGMVTKNSVFGNNRQLVVSLRMKKTETLSQILNKYFSVKIDENSIKKYKNIDTDVDNTIKLLQGAKYGDKDEIISILFNISNIISEIYSLGIIFYNKNQFAKENTIVHLKDQFIYSFNIENIKSIAFINTFFTSDKCLFVPMYKLDIDDFTNNSFIIEDKDFIHIITSQDRINYMIQDKVNIEDTIYINPNDINKDLNIIDIELNDGISKQYLLGSTNILYNIETGDIEGKIYFTDDKKCDIYVC